MPTRRFSLRAASSASLFFFYLLLLLWAPVPLGSNRPWSIAVLNLWVFALGLWWLLGYLLRWNEFGPVPARAWPAVLCGGLWTAWVWLQLLPLPFELLRALSPETARMQAMAAMGAPVLHAPLTLDRYLTHTAALQSAAYFVFFVLTLALVNTRRRIATVAYVLVLSGVVQAMYGGITAMIAGDVASGTFKNRNHLAGYLELCLAMGLGLLIGSITGGESRSWRQFLRNAAGWILSRKMLLRIALAIMVIGLVLTRSRMGNSAFFSALLVAGAIGLLLSRHATRSMVLLIASLVVIDIVIIGSYFGVEKVVERIENTELKNERVEAFVAMDACWDYSVTGFGLGAFRTVFHRYRGPEFPEGSFPTHAHNDFIEFACETGAVGITLAGGLVLLSFLAALRAQQVRRDPLMRGMSFGALMAIVSLMIHSTVDFNLQIPANALTFMLVLAMAWIALFHEREQSRESGAGAA